MSPYTMPNLGHLLEQLQNSPHRPPLDNDEIKGLNNESSSSKNEASEALNKSNSSSCGDLVMDEEDRVSSPVVKREEDATKPPQDINSNSGDLEAVTRILETVSASVTKHILQANMQKYNNENSNDAPSMVSAHSPAQDLTCNHCKKSFTSQSSLDEHECDRYDVKSEGLAAKLEDAITTKSEEVNGSISGNDEDKNDEYDLDCESTDQLSEDGRKVRVRSLISDEQLKVLKDCYAKNPRPKREELAKIAEKIGFQVRVVQVWFQNTRARDRREGRMIQVPFNPPPLPLRFNQPFVPSNASYMPQHKSYPLANSPNTYASEQPLDLSTKKENHSNNSSPSSSPQRPSSAHHSDSEEAVNLSQKSSRSPTPFQHAYYQNSNCSSDPQRSPSPGQLADNSSRLAQILSQPRLGLPGIGLVPMDHLMQLGAQDLNSLTQLITNRMSSLSPNSEKRSWSEVCENSPDGDDEIARRNKVSRLMKSLGSPMLAAGPDGESEGQFTCDQCDKAFSKQSSLARHKYEHSGM